MIRNPVWGPARTILWPPQPQCLVNGGSPLKHLLDQQNENKTGLRLFRKNKHGKIDYNKGQLYINLWLVSIPLCTYLHVSLFPR